MRAERHPHPVKGSTSSVEFIVIERYARSLHWANARVVSRVAMCQPCVVREASIVCRTLSPTHLERHPSCQEPRYPSAELLLAETMAMQVHHEMLLWTAAWSRTVVALNIRLPKCVFWGSIEPPNPAGQVEAEKA